MGATQSNYDGGRKRSVTSRSRLLLDQRTPAEREMSYEAKKTRQKRTFAIISGIFLLLAVVAVIVFFLYFYEDLMGDSEDTPWSLSNNIKLPDGFKIEEYVKGNEVNRIFNPRSLHVTPFLTSTIVYVGSSTPFVYGLIDLDSDGINDQTFLLFECQDPLCKVNSIAVDDVTATLYIDDQVGNIWHCLDVHRQVLSLRFQDERLNCSIWMSDIPLPGSNNVNNDHYLAINHLAANPADRNLCIAFGVASNAVIEPIPGSFEGTIRCFTENAQSIDDTILYAEGVRNCVGFEFHPYNPNELWFTDCAPDIGQLLNDIPDDELNNVTQPDQNFGFPYCHTRGFGNIRQRNPAQRENIVDNVVGEPNNITCEVDEYFPAYQPLGPRVESFGMKFVFIDDNTRNDGLPSKFMLIAQHGSESTLTGKIGYRVMMVEFFGNGVGSNIVGYKSFAEGWLDDDTVYGRPVDVEWLRKPGSLNNNDDNGFIVSDDFANVIYRIYYDEENVVE